MKRLGRLGVLIGAVSLCVALGVVTAWATELVYTPINPSFGGNPLNGQFLLNEAQAQNNFTEDFHFPDMHFPKMPQAQGKDSIDEGVLEGANIGMVIINVYQEGTGNFLLMNGW